MSLSFLFIFELTFFALKYFGKVGLIFLGLDVKLFIRNNETFFFVFCRYRFELMKIYRFRIFKRMCFKIL